MLKVYVNDAIFSLGWLKFNGAFNVFSIEF